MTRSLLALTLALTVLSPALALAQDGDSPSRTEVFDDADLVTGDLQSPMVDRISGARRHGHGTLIRPRAHYNPEMLRSVENL